MFDDLALRSLMSHLAGTKHVYVRLAIIIHCKILALFSNFEVLLLIVHLNLSQSYPSLFHFVVLFLSLLWCFAILVKDYSLVGTDFQVIIYITKSIKVLINSLEYSGKKRQTKPLI